MSNLERDPGREYPDPTPVARPVNWQAPPTIQDQIRRFVREEYSRYAADQGQETFDDADDFDVGDDPPDRTSDHELDADVESLPRWSESEQKGAAIRQAEDRIIATQKARDARRNGDPTQDRRKTPPAKPAE